MIGDLTTEDRRFAFSSVVLADRLDGRLELRDRRVVGKRRWSGCRIGTRSRVANRDRGHRRDDNANLLRLGRRAPKKRYGEGK